MAIAQGVECVQWFEGRDGDSGPMGLLDAKGEPRQSVFGTTATMIKHFGQHPEYLGWILLNDLHYAFVFQWRGWASDGRMGQARTAGHRRLRQRRARHRSDDRHRDDPEIDPVGQCPVFVLDVPEKLIEQAKANREKPFPWGGDYTDAAEVSVEYGEKTVEKGLHTRSGAHVAKAVVAYGGSARAGGVPGGNTFIVDPNFLSHTKTPIEITVVVRRNPENVNSGFKLVYESPTGFKTAGGWFTIPDNKEWHTKTWRIDDPEFVNYWGFNFVLESDGDVYNKYLIRSVSVKKLKP